MWERLADLSARVPASPIKSIDLAFTAPIIPIPKTLKPFAIGLALGGSRPRAGLSRRVVGWCRCDVRETTERVPQFSSPTRRSSLSAVIMLIAALSTNLAIHMVWIPMMHVIFCLTQESSKWLLWLNSTIGLDSYSWLTFFADYMARDYAATYMAFCMSLLSFVWMLDATESLDTFLDTWSKYSKVPDPKSISSLGIPRSNSTEIKSIDKHNKIIFSCNKLEAQVTVIAHFQSGIPGPSVASKTSSGLLTSRTVVARWTLTARDSPLLKFRAPQVHSAITSTRTPTRAVLFAFTMYGRLLISRVFVQLPSHISFS
ncbi:hypothetical protein ALC60_04368 [Trachymyrmex zeteki]|uniref:Uncharacterized protein n=1 Tax=Mycetomoellerius zeteki TaxID=64791 RepID=A0A151X8W3_9HYME|nr:hypothetical protein ALC60_04368 [Trachymyrmex zeteki]